MRLADGAAGWVSGAVGALGLIAFLAGARQRRSGLIAAASALLALAAAAWFGRDELPGWLAAALSLLVMAAALLSIEVTLRALRASQAQRQVLQQRLAEHGAQLDEARQQMQQAQATAEAADQAKARFLAAASHDLRQPAHALGLYTAALRAGPLAPAQAEVVDRMQATLLALEALFAALLDVSRMDAGAVLPQWDTVLLAPLLQRLAQEWAPQAEARGLRLAVHIADPAAMTVTDPVLLERVLRNLLANAVAHTPRGGVLLACRPRTSADGESHLRIEVWDSGVGIAPADQERVFDEFFQVSNGRAIQRTSQRASQRASQQADQRKNPHINKPGQGLGLAIVQRLVRLLQLRVVLHSRPGRGSVFFLEGLAPAGVAPLAVAAARLQMRLQMRRLAGLLVAVLEDEDDVRDATRRLLQLWDCRVVDGASATELLQRLPQPQDAPQALVADLQLAAGKNGGKNGGKSGGESGVDEVRRLQAAWGHAVPVLWISGETAPDGLRAALPAGATVLTKPVSPARLRAWLEQQLPDPAESS